MMRCFAFSGHLLDLLEFGREKVTIAISGWAFCMNVRPLAILFQPSP